MTFTLFGYRTTLLKWEDVAPETKARVVANIEQANSREYQMQVAEHHFVNSVIDDVLSDPYWFDIAQQAAQLRAERG